jgi:pyridoxamine 5'-phosphate oxidase
MLRDSFKHNRKDYKFGTLEEKDLHEDPFKQFEIWYLDLQKQLTEHGVSKEINAMALATTCEDQPRVRTVLLKDYGHDLGFVFYTNYKSSKGQELENNPKASILFYWSEVERQVRIEGIVKKIALEISDEYFYSRPKQAQFAAMASNQSSVLESRDLLEQKYQEVQKSEAKRPEHWGGYSLIPNYFEFWQGRESRLHDRLCYTLSNSNWNIARLAP